MGIRFACHVCQKPLNIKIELAGKRGFCPQCTARFRIPQSDTAFSIPIDDAKELALEENVGDFDFDSDEDAIASPPSGSAAGIDSPPSVNPASITTNLVANATAQRRTGTPSLLDDLTATWYVRPPSGGQYGPATGEMLRAWISEARVIPTSLIWRDGWPQWRSAAEALAEFGGSKSSDKPASVLNGPKTATLSPAATAEPVSLSGDATIGVRKSKITQRRFVIVGTLAAISMTLIGILIFLLQR